MDFTVGIEWVLGIFYVNPYMDATLAEFYVAIRTESIAKGLVVEGELPGYSVQIFKKKNPGKQDSFCFVCCYTVV